MHLGMKDKLYFTKVIKDAKVFFDFGCADGSMIYYLSEIYPDAKFFGFDANEDMIEDAMGMELPNAVFSSDWEFILEQCIEAMDDDHKCCLILSSVIHEINTYLKNDDRARFWEFALRTGFHYIAIRDMCITQRAAHAVMPIVARDDVRKLWEYGDPQMLDDFTKYWGGLFSGIHFYHFLLKYHYRENWERELKENYITVLEDIMEITDIKRYNTIWMKHYQLDYIKDKIKEELGIEIKENTHLQLILERSDL